MRPVEHRTAQPGNPGASRSVLRRHGAGASDATAPRAPGGLGTSAGSGWRLRVLPHRGPGAGRCGRSSGCRGHSGCTTPPGRDSVRTGTGAPVGPRAPRPGRRCWTDASQRATLLRHRLHRHGVGRGTVVKLACQSDRCRAHLLRHGRCCIPSASRATPARLGLQPRSPQPPRAASLAALQGGQAGELPHRHPRSDPSMESTQSSPATKPPPLRRIDAVPDQRSQPIVVGAG